MGTHITKLTDAYDKQLDAYNRLTTEYNALAEDLTEFFR